MRIFLYSLSVIYGLITSIRNMLFDIGILESIRHKVPVICIGNLSIGGSGKTPHTNYITKLLSPKYNVAILSRGYGRTSSGFKYVYTNSSPYEIGDEPLQLKLNNPNCIVAVNKNRNEGIKRILSNYPATNVILLDDGFQHRSTNAGLNILLTPFLEPFIDDHIIPLGRLRESKAAANRADVVLLTKTPLNTKEINKNAIVKRLNLKKFQEEYFSSIIYNKYRCIINNEILENEKDYSVTLVCGIANPGLIVEYLKKQKIKVNLIKFNDHHKYTSKDIKNILSIHKKNKSVKKLILTTEKDAEKIKQFSSYLSNEKVYYLPIEIIINNKEKFEKRLLNYVTKN